MMGRLTPIATRQIEPSDSWAETVPLAKELYHSRSKHRCKDAMGLGAP